MKIKATLRNFDSSEYKNIIVRNLNRILDIRILDLNPDKGTITVLYQTEDALRKLKRELQCIGFPIRMQKISSNNLATA
ncbi:hypothetical protein [Poritiphilus flavus]|uniref:Heavy-metal-associated domain-containing protein n=1 Tax=Poritiphilus flavus TaxID=2697053 RepID=A0A6L9EAZ3_9FLAO|nr:hypothetical protein [Poritiphilus flavus]NAS11927.1 hypothetical protein [Poritiphilus flavus]